jgi:putative MATE family efflux protein
MFPRATKNDEESRQETDRLLTATKNDEESRHETDLLLPSNEQQSDESSTGQQILSLAIPALGALLIDPLMTLADTAFVGRYADTSDQLAGMGSAAALLTFSFYLFNFFCTATTPLVASRRAAGNEQGALDIGGQALSLSLFMGTVLAIVLLAFSQPLLQVMGTSLTGEMANEYATSFLIVRAFAAPAVLCISASTGILRGYLDTKTPIYILFFANLVNVALDVLLVAQGGMGPMGAAIATTTAEWICAISFLLILAGKLPSADGQLGSNRRDGTIVSVTPSLSIPAWEDVKPLLVASSSVLLRSFVLQSSLSGAAAMAARSGDQDASASVAAHQIAIQLWFLCSFICDALAAASQGLVADALGRESQEKAREISITVFVYSLVLGVILAAGLWVGESTRFLLDLFTQDITTQRELQEILTIIILAQPLNSLVFAADGVLQGASEFPFQAKAMAVSGSTAFVFFLAIQNGGSADTLVHVWMALIVLQAMRGLTSLYKLADKQGPINLFAAK